MKYLILGLMLVGCEMSNSPENLKRKDAETASCVEKCKPRPMEQVNTWFGCLCVEKE